MPFDDQIKVDKAKGYDLRILDLLRVSFGYKRLLYWPVPNTKRWNKAKYENLQALDYKFETKSSYLNTPILMPLKIQISPKGETVEYFTFPNEPIVEIRGTKDIIETKIDGQDGSFKQLYSLGDYQVTIRGIALDEKYESEDYPEDVVRKLRTVWELRHHLEVVGPLFTLFNIKYISLTNFDLIPQPGEQSLQPYEFLALSDKEFKLELKKKGSA